MAGLAPFIAKTVSSDNPQISHRPKRHSKSLSPIRPT